MVVDPARVREFPDFEAFHDWLAKHHDREPEVWIRMHKKGSGLPSIDWQQAVAEAIAWGWIDGIRKTVNETSWQQRFTPRKPGSSWSQINTAHATRLIAEGRMQPAGQRHIDIAKQNGRWDTAYSGGKGADLPKDFLTALAKAPEAARQTLATLKAADRFAIYYRLTTAKRPETRTKRLADFITRLTKGQRPT